MENDLIKVVYNGETIMSISNNDIKKNLINEILSFPANVSEVLLMSSGNKRRKAKKFVLKESNGIVFSNLGLTFLFPAGTIIYVYI